MRNRTLIGLVLLAICLLPSASAQAGLIVGAFGSIPWVPQTNPQGSVPVSIPISYSGSGDSLIQSFGMAIKIVPQAGASGSLGIGALTDFPENDNPLFNTFATAAPIQNPITGGAILNGDNAQFLDVNLAGGSKNALSLSFFGAGAGGSFDVYLLSSSKYFTTTEFDGTKFLNASSADLLLGTIVVPVPEPTSLVLLAGGIAGVLGCVAIRRRKTACA